MMSLIDKDDYATNTTLTVPYTFYRLFQKSDHSPNTAILNHPTKDIVLPATTLTANCYDGLFADVPNITRTPELPATTLTDWCYSEMFSGCTSLNYVKCLATDISAESCTFQWMNNVAATGTFESVTGTGTWVNRRSP